MSAALSIYPSPYIQYAPGNSVELLLLCGTQPFYSFHPSVQRMMRICQSPGVPHSGEDPQQGKYPSHGSRALLGRALLLEFYLKHTKINAEL